MLRLWIANSVRFLKNEDGPTSVEYAVMLASIILVCYAVIGNLGQSTKSSFENPALNSALSSASSS
jgi:pilus assembly protein Flp/PilA